MAQTTTRTIEQVKDMLPPVRVLMPDGSTKNGTLAGRECDYAAVFVDGMRVGEWSWQSVTHCLNNGKPLRA